VVRIFCFVLIFSLVTRYFIIKVIQRKILFLLIIALLPLSIKSGIQLIYVNLDRDIYIQFQPLLDSQGVSVDAGFLQWAIWLSTTLKFQNYRWWIILNDLMDVVHFYKEENQSVFAINIAIRIQFLC
jgi:hypothetical protein